MLFVGVFKQKASASSAELTTRRAQWNPSEGVEMLGGYWLQTNDPTLPGIVSIFETEDVASIVALFADWDDAFDITVVPAISAEQGLRMIQEMVQQ